MFATLYCGRARGAQTWHVLTNERVWSADSSRVVYDVRSNHIFNGDRIATVGVTPGDGSSVLYQRESRSSGGCGIALFLAGPRAEQVAFIKGPGRGDPNWAYSFWHRHGVLQNASNPGQLPQVRSQLSHDSCTGDWGIGCRYIYFGAGMPNEMVLEFTIDFVFCFPCIF
jgi:hypothetical protein